MTTRTLDDVLADLDVAMVATPDAEGVWRARPLSLAGQEGDGLAFLVSVEADWVAGLPDGGAPTTVTFSDPKANTYVALHGRATVVDDRARIRELWNVGADAWFDDADNPVVRVLDVGVEHGEWWDGPSGRIGQLVQLASAALGREQGDQGDVAL